MVPLATWLLEVEGTPVTPRVAPGIYNYRLAAPAFTARGRVVVLP